MHQLVPEFILRKLGQEELEGEFQATALFIDITGFSTMTETLMQHGQHGAEVLADLMCSVFDPMITTVYQYGGFVSTLAGDAITAIFPSNNKTELSVRQALASAWDIRESVRDRLISTVAAESGRFPLLQGSLDEHLDLRLLDLGRSLIVVAVDSNSQTAGRVLLQMNRAMGEFRVSCQVALQNCVNLIHDIQFAIRW